MVQRNEGNFTYQGVGPMRVVIVVLATFLFAGLGSEAFAHEVIAESWRAHHGVFSCQELDDATGNAMECILCHTDGGGSGDLNPYAVEIQTYKYANEVIWQIAVASIKDIDSDGDGVDNGTEIDDDCTFPGDATSVPVSKETWSGIKALYR
jgi:hypothetical protein